MTEPPPRERRHRVGAVLVASYLVAAGLVLVAGDRLAVPAWLALHLLLLGAATNAVLVWSRHFAQALLHAELGSERAAHARLATMNAGVVGVLVGLPLAISPLVVAGASLVVGTAVWHGASLVRMSRTSPLGGRLRGCVHYYVAAAGALAVGGTLGGLMGTATATSSGVHLAHVHANVFGWLGLTVLGTLFMLWPAVLRTRMADDASAVARRALPPLGAGLAVAVAALALLPGGAGPGVGAAGMAVFAGAALYSLTPFLTAVRRKAPRDAPAWMLAASTGWLVLALLVDVVGLARGTGPALAAFDRLLPVLAVGLVGQVLVGALTFLLPVVLGGGPAGNRRLSALLHLGWVARLVLLNAGVGVLLVAPEGPVRSAAGALALVALAAAVPLVLAAVVTSRRPQPSTPRPAPSPAARRTDWTEQVAVGSVLAVLAALSLVAAPATAETVGSGETRTVAVTLTDFAMLPDRIEVEAGTRLVLEVVNEGQARHDVRFPGGRSTPVLAPGGTARLDVGVVTGDLEGWCTVAGHRAAGMTLDVVVDGEGGAEAPDDGHHHGDPGHGDPGHGVPAGSGPPPDWVPYDPTLAPAPGGSEHRVTLRVQETDVVVAPGTTQRMWTFGGTVPGPTLRGEVGDLFVVTLVNDGTVEHSIDFHASSVSPDEAMRSIPPGESLVYAFRAEHAGAWLYHCSTMPMIQHVGMGMYGAVVIDPPDLAPVDRELVVVQSEVWLLDGDEPPPLGRMTSADEDLVVFNGSADQYVHAPVEVGVGDRVRMWVVNAGPSQASAFHVVGAQFDTVYEEGRYALRPGDPGGAQVLDVPPGAGGFVELVVPAAGRYPFVTHRLADAARGATGLLHARD